MMWYLLVGAFGALSVYFWKRLSSDEKQPQKEPQMTGKTAESDEDLVENIEHALNKVSAQIDEQEKANVTTATSTSSSTSQSQPKQLSTTPPVAELSQAARRAPVAGRSVCTEDLSALTAIPMGQPFQFTVQTRDLDGRDCNVGGAPIQARAEDGEGSTQACDVRDHQDGSYAVSFTPTMSGQHSLHVMLGTKRHIKGSPFTVNVSAPLPGMTRADSTDDVQQAAPDATNEEAVSGSAAAADNDDGATASSSETDPMARALATHDAKRAAAAAAVAAEQQEKAQEAEPVVLVPQPDESDDDDESYRVAPSRERFIEDCSADGLALLADETPPRDLTGSESDEDFEDYDIVVLNESARYRVGFAETQGPRATMEDAMVIYGRFRDRDEEDLFGVFDGHGGEDASDLASDYLYEVLERALDEEPSAATLADVSPSATDRTVHAALIESFVQTHQEIVSEERGISCGTTALVTYIRGETGFVANVGDSRAVLAKSDGRVVRLTRDHKADDEIEIERVRARGGFVARGRVNAVIAIARALGDKSLAEFLGHSPDVFEFDVTDSDLLIMACDGIWDVLSDEEAVRIARSTRDPARAAVRLRDQAIDRNSRDNVSVLVIHLKSLTTQPKPTRGREPVVNNMVPPDGSRSDDDELDAQQDDQLSQQITRGRVVRARTDNSTAGAPPRPNF